MREKIDRDIVTGMSLRKIADKYDLGGHQKLIGHRAKHVSRRLEMAQLRKDVDASQRLLDDTDMLWNESLATLEESKEAVRTQPTTVGKRTVYKEYKDLTARVAAIKLLHDNRRLFGDAAGVLGQKAPQTAVVLHIAIPCAIPGGQSVVTTQVIDVTPQEQK